MSWLVRIQIERGDVEPVISQLWDAGTTGVAEIELDGRCELVAGFEEEGVARELADRWSAALVEPVDQQAWTATDRSTVSVGDRQLDLEVGAAFGHGAHPTTSLVLDLMASSDGTALRSVLDVGTGTGVLALAAAIHGAGSILGMDIDADAVSVARRNAERNRLLIPSGTSLSFTTDRLEELPLRQFDLVLANLLLADLRPIAPAIVDRIGGRIIISGFLSEQRAEVERLLEPLTVVEHRNDGDWVGLILEP